MKYLHRYHYLFLLFFVFGCDTTQAQSNAATKEVTITLDLATNIQPTFPLTPGTEVQIRLTNIIPNAQYRIAVNESLTPIPPLNIAKPVRAAPTNCSNLIDSFVDATNESQIKAARAADTGVCTDVDEYNNVLALTAQTEYLFPSSLIVRSGYQYDIKIERITTAGQVVTIVKTWTSEISGGELGNWSTSYGFNFIPNQDDNFFSMQDSANPAQFKIEKKTDREEFDFAPSVFFRWRDANSPKDHGPVFGLGFDLEDPIVFAGYGKEFGGNITLVAGVVAHKQTRLDGKYNTGQTLSESLEEKQLLEDTYQANFFFGVTFRFDSNPFSSGGNN